MDGFTRINLMAVWLRYMQLNLVDWVGWTIRWWNMMCFLSKQIASNGLHLTHPGIRLCALCHVVCLAAVIHSSIAHSFSLLLLYSPSYWDSRLSYEIFVQIHSYYQNLTVSDRRELRHVCSQGTAYVVPNLEPAGTNLIPTLSWN